MAVPVVPGPPGLKRSDLCREAHDLQGVGFAVVGDVGVVEGLGDAGDRLHDGAGGELAAEDEVAQDRSRLCRSAEGVGFEPTRTRQRPSGFQDLRLNRADQRRLRHERQTWHAFGTSASSRRSCHGRI